MATKKKNAQDATLRNIRALKKKLAEHETRLDDLEAMVGKRTKGIPSDVVESDEEPTLAAQGNS